MVTKSNEEHRQKPQHRWVSTGNILHESGSDMENNSSSKEPAELHFPKTVQEFAACCLSHSNFGSQK